MNALADVAVSLPSPRTYDRDDIGGAVLWRTRSRDILRIRRAKALEAGTWPLNRFAPIPEPVSMPLDLRSDPPGLLDPLTDRGRTMFQAMQAIGLGKAKRGRTRGQKATGWEATIEASITDLAHETGFARTTARRIVDELVRKHYIAEYRVRERGETGSENREKSVWHIRTLTAIQELQRNDTTIYTDKSNRQWVTSRRNARRFLTPDEAKVWDLDSLPAYEPRRPIGASTARRATEQAPKPAAPPEMDRWQRVLSAVRDYVTSEAFDNWISRSHLIADDGTSLTIGVPDKATRDYLDMDYAQAIATAAERAGVLVPWTYELASGAPKPEEPPPPTLKERLEWMMGRSYADTESQADAVREAARGAGYFALTDDDVAKLWEFAHDRKPDPRMRQPNWYRKLIIDSLLVDYCEHRNDLLQRQEQRDLARAIDLLQNGPWDEVEAFRLAVPEIMWRWEEARVLYEKRRREHEMSMGARRQGTD